MTNEDIYKMDWQTLLSAKRFGLEEYHRDHPENRSEFQRDYDRLIFSAPFRRLQNKTQVFPLPGSIFVHNRLTHSLEVASVGRSLGNDVARLLVERHPELRDTYVPEIGAIVSAACLAHDLGNPPFGHSGERAISTFFSEGRGQSLREPQPDGTCLTPGQWEDLTHFEGNATAIVKYPYASSLAGRKSKFGFFTTEEESYRRIAGELGIPVLQEHPLRCVRHPLVYLVEAADDICYQIMDIEDAYKLKLLTLAETRDLLLAYFDDERRQRRLNTLHIVSDTNEQIAYLRSSVIGLLIQECTRAFMDNEQALLAGTFDGPLIRHIAPRPAEAYARCAAVAGEKIYRSKDVLDIELAGFRIISTLLELMLDAVRWPDRAYSRLLIDRVSSQYAVRAPGLYERVQAVLDYVSGMTDVFALDLYRKINGNSLPEIS